MATALGSQAILEVNEKPFSEKDGAHKPLANANGFTPSEGGWGWVVCFTSMLANGIVLGIMNTFGILYVPIRERYAGEDPDDISFKTAWIGSVCTGLTLFLSITASILTDQIGIRPVSFFGALLGSAGLVASAFVEQLELLYLTYGVLLGVGSSLLYGPSLTILGHYFKKRIGLVNGLVVCGSPILTISLSLLLPYVLGTIGLKYTLIFLGGLYFLLMWMTLTWRPQIHKESNLAHMTLSTESIAIKMNECYTFTKKYLNFKIWRNKKYVIWVLSLGVSLFGYFVPFVHLVKHTADVFPGSNGNLLVMCMSITSGVSRLVCGKVADFKSINIILLQQTGFIVLGATTICIPFAGNFASLVAICLLMGVCDGIYVCLLGPIAFELVGHNNASQAIGFLLGVISVPMMVGPPVAGFMYDSLGTYKLAFHVSGIPPIVGALLMFLTRRVSSKRDSSLELNEIMLEEDEVTRDVIKVEEADERTPEKPGDMENRILRSDARDGVEDKGKSM